MAAITRMRPPSTSHSPLKLASKTLRRSSSNLAPRVIQYEPGLILLKSALSFDAQTMLAQAAMQSGRDPEKGFYKKDEEGKIALNSRPFRGRMYGPVDQYPPAVTKLCQEALRLAAKHDPAIQEVAPTHVITLIYKTLKELPKEIYMPWHQDNGDNDGDGNTPVVSFSVGDSCDFLVNHEKPKISKEYPASNPKNLAHRILFESGDVLIFGGPCRNIWHSIYQIHPNTSPGLAHIQGERINFTFRFTPNLKGREEEFATVPADKIPKNSQFYKLSKM